MQRLLITINFVSEMILGEAALNLFMKQLVKELNENKIRFHIDEVIISNIGFADDAVFLMLSIIDLRRILRDSNKTTTMIQVSSLKYPDSCYSCTDVLYVLTVRIEKKVECSVIYTNI